MEKEISRLIKLIKNFRLNAEKVGLTEADVFSEIEEVRKDLLKASQSSLKFWDNQIDDEVRKAKS